MNRCDFLQNTAATATAGIIPNANREINARAARYAAIRAENRRCILRLPMGLLETILGGWAQLNPQHFSLPIWKNLPPDVLVFGVHWDFSYQGFSVLLGHESFEPQPDGAELPLLPGGWTEYVVFEKLATRYERYELKK